MAIVAHSAVIPNPPVTTHPTSTLTSSLKTAKPVFSIPVPSPHPSANLPPWKSVVSPHPPHTETGSASTQFRISPRKSPIASSSHPTRVFTRLSSQHTKSLTTPSLSPTSTETIDLNPISQAEREEVGSGEDSSESEDADMLDMEETDDSMAGDDDAAATIAASTRSTRKTPSSRTPIRNPTDCTLIDRTKNLLFPTTTPQAVKDGVPNLPEKKKFFEAVSPSSMGTFSSSHGLATYMCVTSQRPLIYERSI